MPITKATHLVDPRGHGTLNTITRAELAAILVDLEHGYTVVATDSAGALYLIRRALMYPMTCTMHKHRQILTLVVRAQHPQQPGGRYTVRRCGWPRRWTPPPLPASGADPHNLLHHSP